MLNTTDHLEGPAATAFTPMQAVAQQPLLAKALSSTASPAFIADSAGQIIWLNHAFLELSGYAESELLGKPASILRNGRRENSHYAQAWQAVQRGQNWNSEVVDAHRDGTTYTVEEIITPLFDEDGAISHFFVIRHDVTQRTQRSEHIQHLADHDELTGLLNRSKFRKELALGLAAASSGPHMLAALFVDLDHFKPVNDTLGHHIGDLLLAAVANRLRGAVRNGDLIARCGGDEFAVMLTDLPDAAVAVALAGKLLTALGRPFILQGHTVSVSASIGVSFFPEDGHDARALLIKADRAMYAVKHAGGNGVKTYHQGV